MSAGRGYVYGPQPPLTGVCPVCTERIKVKEDGTLQRHRRRPSKPTDCPGSGIAPRTGSVKRKWPTTVRGRSVRAVSGGATESDRRRH
jgi:hypothetical protein